MTTEIKEKCRFCGKVLIHNSSKSSDFSHHILTKHKDEPEVKNYLKLQEIIHDIWNSFMLERKVVMKDKRGEMRDEN